MTSSLRLLLIRAQLALVLVVTLLLLAACDRAPTALTEVPQRIPISDKRMSRRPLINRSGSSSDTISPAGTAGHPVFRQHLNAPWAGPPVHMACVTAMRKSACLSYKNLE